MSLGGRAAEQAVYGDTTTGAESDIENLRGSLAEWWPRGMSEALGPLAIADGPQDGFSLPARRPPLTRDAGAVDDETRRIVEEAENEVVGLPRRERRAARRARARSPSRSRSTRPTPPHRRRRGACGRARSGDASRVLERRRCASAACELSGQPDAGREPRQRALQLLTGVPDPLEPLRGRPRLPERRHAMIT